MCTGARTAPYHLLDQTINRRQMCGDIHRSPHMWSMRTMTYCTTSSLLCKQLQTIMQLITSFCSLLITQFLSSWSCSDLRLTAAHTLHPTPRLVTPAAAGSPDRTRRGWRNLQAESQVCAFSRKYSYSQFTYLPN